MIDVSDEAADIMLSGGYTMYTRVESWKGGDLLDDNIPIESGSETVDVTLNVPEAIELTVPRLYRGTNYAPGSDVEHPLACWGQRLRIYVGVGTSSGVEWIRRQWAYIDSTKVDGDAVNISALGLLGLVQEANFISPVAAAGTYGSMLKQLVEPAITVDLTNAPADRAMPSGTTWDSGRLDAVNELLDAWPATAYVNEDGILVVVAVGDATVSSLALSDGIGGTTMAWGGGVTREGAASAVVARGYDSTGSDVSGSAFDRDSGSPTYYLGDFNALPVPFEYFSPLLTTTDECTAAAQTVLARRKTQASRKLTTEAVPYLALQARDAVTVTSETLSITGALGIVDQVTMPLTANSGGMSLGVRV